MLLRLDKMQKNTFGFKFKAPTEAEKIATIFAIGTEKRTIGDEELYHWDCHQRPDTETFIFQYTLSGLGEIKLNGKIHELKEGQAFVVAVPSDCEYYLPVEKSDEWHFIFITLEGIEAKKCWEYMNKKHGYIFDVALDSLLIQRLITTYVRVREKQILDPYRASNKAYEFITYCYRHFETDDASEVLEVSDDITAAISFIEENYHENLNIEDICDHVGLSKSHLNKKFKKYVELPPIAYLNNYRIEKSIHLLEHTKKNIKEISSELGFVDPNYFTKVFKKTTGITPVLFRKNKSNVKVFDYLITDHHGIIDLD